MKTIPNRGIPSKETLWLPPHSEVRTFQDENEVMTRNIFRVEEVLSFVFPPKYQVKYHEIALAFMNRLIETGGKIKSEDIAGFVKEKGLSKATFYNRVLPRLRRAGMIKIEREVTQDLQTTKKKRKMLISISKTFGNYLMKISDSWLAVVDDAKSRK